MSCLLLIGLVACARVEAPLPPSPRRIGVVMDEFSFSTAAELAAGRVVFDAVNSGELRHEMIVISIPPDVPSLEAQLRSEERRATTTVAVIPPQDPAGSSVFALDLQPGRYGLLCFLRSGEGNIPHALRGMNAEFRVL